MSDSYKGITIPEYTDAADGPAAFVHAVDSGPVPRFATTADRNAAFQAPEAGVLTFVLPDKFEWFNGSSWVALSGDYALAVHTHDAGDIVSGTLAAARLPHATASGYGATMLQDSTTSTATDRAATPNSVKTVSDHLAAHTHDSTYSKLGHVHSYLSLASGGTVSGVVILNTVQHSDNTALRFSNMGPRYGLYGNNKEFSIAMDTRRLTVWEPTAANSRGSGILEVRGTPSSKYTISGGDGVYEFKLTAKALNWLQRYN